MKISYINIINLL